MQCCPESEVHFINVFNDDFSDPVNFNDSWLTAESWNLSGQCPRYHAQNKYGHDPVYWAPENVEHGTTLDENGNSISCIKLKVDKVSQPYTCVENGKTITAYFTGGMIWSQQQFRYGKFEVKFKLPAGAALWPAFWLWGGDELDVMEAWGYEDNGPGTTHWSVGSQNSPMTNPNGNFNVAYGANSLNQLPPMKTGEWNTMICEHTPYKTSITLNKTVVKEFFRYYEICGTDTIGIDCSTNNSCNGKIIENLAFCDGPMHIAFNITTIPTYEWGWGGQPNVPLQSLIDNGTLTLPAIAEVAYIKVDQLKLPGSNNDPNVGTVWGQCQNNDFCGNRFGDADLFKSSHAMICGKEKVFNIESSWNPIWDPGTFQCNDMILTADPGLNANFNCSPDNASVSINADSYNQDYTFQLTVPKNPTASCVSEAGRIIKHTVQFLEKLAPVSMILDDLVSIIPEGTYSTAVGNHYIKAAFQQSPPTKFWWIIDGVKYENKFLVVIVVKSGNNKI